MASLRKQGAALALRSGGHLLNAVMPAVGRGRATLQPGPRSARTPTHPASITIYLNGRPSTLDGAIGRRRGAAGASSEGRGGSKGD